MYKYISRSKSLRTPSNIFILNLAVFDLLMATEMPMLIINSFLERTIGWETGCDVYALLGAISGMGQAITNAAIAFDRYRSLIELSQFLLIIIGQKDSCMFVKI